MVFIDKTKLYSRGNKMWTLTGKFVLFFSPNNFVF